MILIHVALANLIMAQEVVDYPRKRSGSQVGWQVLPFDRKVKVFSCVDSLLLQPITLFG